MIVTHIVLFQSKMTAPATSWMALVQPCFVATFFVNLCKSYACI